MRIPLEDIQPADGTSCLEIDGLLRVDGFLDAHTLQRLNLELDRLFSVPLVNQHHKGAIWHSRILREISSPSSISSLNFLELAVDVFHAAIPPSRQSRMILTNFAIFSERSNRRSLPWHTDQRRGMIRAQIYVRGGTHESGAFLYMRGTQRIDHRVEHLLAPDEIDRMNDTVVDCSGQAGDLIAFDSFGFHAKTECVQERRIIAFEFQDVDSPDIKSSLDLNNAKVTDKVIEHWNIFRRPQDLGTYGRHGLDFFRSNEYVPLALVSELLRSVARYQLKRVRRVAGRAIQVLRS